MKRFVLLGDSITQEGGDVGGWAQRLAYRYIRRADVFNRGFSGYNTRWANKPIVQALPKDDIDFATLFFGANDASSGSQHVPVNEYKSNLNEMIIELRNRNCKRIVIIAPPPIAAEMYLEAWRDKAESRGLSREDVSQDRSNELLKPYSVACNELGTELDLPVLNLFELIDHETCSEYLRDGLHLNEKGNLFVFEQLAKLIESKFSDINVIPDPVTNNPANCGSSCSGIPPEFPWWGDIDSVNPLSKDQLNVRNVKPKI